MATIPDCEICDNTRVIYDDNIPKRCSCIQEYKYRKYISQIGSIEEPEKDQIKKELEELSDLKKDLWINIRYNLSEKELNWVIAHLLSEVYPLGFDYINISELYLTLNGSDDYSQVLEYDKPLCIISGGLTEEYEGYTQEDGIKWTDDAYFNVFKQLFGNRFRNGKPTWYVSLRNPYTEIGNLLNQKGVENKVLGNKSDSEDFVY